MGLARAVTLCAVGLFVAAPPALTAQDDALKVTVPELTAGEVAKAVSDNMDYVRWRQELKDKVVKWSGVVAEPSAELQEWFKRTFRGELLQVELPEVRCAIEVPDNTSYAKGSTLTFTAKLEGFIAATEYHGRLGRLVAGDKPVIVFAGGLTTPLFEHAE